MLVQAGACREQRKAFVEIFGYKVKVSQMTLRKADSYGLWLLWFGEHFCHNKQEWDLDLHRYCQHHFKTQDEDHEYKVWMVWQHTCNQIKIQSLKFND